MRASGAPERGPSVERDRLLEEVGDLRPRLHGYCTRLMGSPLDGEDAVQDALAQALRKPPHVSNHEELGHWLFRVAHNRCIDMLRRRTTRSEADSSEAPLEDEMVEPPDARAMKIESVDHAFRELLGLLPPKERAAVLLKDVLDFSLKEIAEIIASTEGGVKAAVHRGRAKLSAARDGQIESANAPLAAPRDDEHARLLKAYSDRFNAHDWDGLISLLRADARLQVLEAFDGRGVEGFQRGYFRNYSRLLVEWRARVGRLGDETVLLVERPLDPASAEGRSWGLYSIVRVKFDGEKIAGVRDYLHVPTYLLESACQELGSITPAAFEDAHLPSR